MVVVSFRLSAFVLKSFVEARRYITVDMSRVNKTLGYILRRQKSQGYFEELGRVIHSELQVVVFLLQCLVDSRALSYAENRFGNN